MTYFEFTKRFPEETSAINFIVSVKYKDGYVCPKCGCVHRIYHQHYILTRRREAHQRYRELLGGAETFRVRHIPSRFRETLATICGRVLLQTEQQGLWRCIFEVCLVGGGINTSVAQ